jgi:hypothetical protein
VHAWSLFDPKLEQFSDFSRLKKYSEIFYFFLKNRLLT